MNPSDQETVFDFPCKYPIKVMGNNSVEFENTVIKILSSHVQEDVRDSFKTKSSTNGKYISITVHITAQNRKQLDAIYLELTGHPDVLYAL